MLRMGIIADMLVEFGHEVVWWTSTFDHNNRRHRFDSDTRMSVSDNYQIQYLKGCGYRRNISVGRFRDNAQVAARFAHLAELDQRKPDIILASIPTVELAEAGVAYGNKHGIPVILDIRDLWPDAFLGLVPPPFRPLVWLVSMPMRRLLRRACAGAAAIVGLTDDFVEWGTRAAGRPKGPHDLVVPMAYRDAIVSEPALAIAREFWDRQSVRNEHAGLRVTFFGTFGRGFDVDVVLRAARMLQERNVPIEFILCGSGEKLEGYKNQAVDLNNVKMPGWVDAAQIKILLSRSDIGLAPYVGTQNFIRNITNKPAEYLSGSLPIASSLPSGALFDLISRYKCGFTYENNPEKLSSLLEYFNNNSSELSSMKRAAASAYVNFFDGEVVYRRFLEYMSQIANGRNH